MATRRPGVPLPRHATNLLYSAGPLVGFPTKVPPDGNLLTDGHTPGDEPDPTMENYRQNLLADFIAYLDGRELLNTRETLKYWDDAAFSLSDPPAIISRYGISLRGAENELFVAGTHVTGPQKYLALTEDYGITWDEVDLPAGFTADPIHVAFNQNVATGTDRGYIASGGTQGCYFDGVDLNDETVPNASGIDGVIWAPGAVEEFLIFGGVSGATGPGVWSSGGDPATQRTVPALAGHRMRDVAWGGTSGAVGISDNGSDTRVWTSPTGQVWTNTGASAGGVGVRLAFDDVNRLFVRVGSNGVSVSTSPDGVTWTAAGAGLPGALPWPKGHVVHGVQCRGGSWVVCTRWSTGTNRPVYVWVSCDLGATWQRALAALPHVGSGQVCMTMLERDGTGGCGRLVLGTQHAMCLGQYSR